MKHTTIRRTIRVLFLTVCTTAALAGCDAGAAGPGEGGENTTATGRMERYAAHRFIGVGDTVQLDGYGTIQDSGTLSAGEAIRVEGSGEGARCVAGGVGWIRFRYRETTQESGVQTLLVACVNEEGSCVGLPRVSADLEAMRAGHVAGASDFFAAGDGSLYALCRTPAGVRLQRPPALPPLMYRVIDAWAAGPYSVQGDELRWLRQTRVTDYSGASHEPVWIATIGRSVTSLQLRADGRLELAWESCATSPECPEDADWVRKGDFVLVGFGAPDFTKFVSQTPADVRKAFAEAHVPGLWDRLAAATRAVPDYTAQDQLLYRLIGIEVMEQVVRDFDERYQLVKRGARVGYSSFWRAREAILCLPADRSLCEEAEARLRVREKQQVDSWRAKRLELWWSGFVGYREDGAYGAPSLPDHTLFDGAFVLLSTGTPAHAGVDRPTALANAIETFATGTPSSLPLAFAVASGPFEHVLNVNGFCEGEVCPSAFSAYFRAFEPAIRVVSETLPANRVVGLGFPVFDGAHFDVRSPYETTAGLTLNRVGETGFNNPLMNLYYAR